MMMQALEIITIGFPFCVFKCVTGLFYGQHWLVALGIIDFVINAANLLSLIVRRKCLTEACLISILIRLIKKPKTDTSPLWHDLGNSVDMLLSFILVATVIGDGAIRLLPADHLWMWNISVIFNVLGAGLGRLTTSLNNLKA